MMDSKTVYKWPIINFSRTASRDNPTRKLESEVFTLSGSNLMFCLQFHPTNMKEPYSYCSVFLCPKNFGGATSIKLEYKFWIENNRGEKIKRKLGYYVRKFSRINFGFGSREFIHHNRLYSPQNDFVKNDFIFICCEVRRLLPNTVEQKQPAIDTKEWKFFDGGFADWCTIRVSNHDFKIGKNKVMAFSSVFEAMFKSGMQEARTGIIMMNDTSPKAIQAMIKYVYTQKVTVSKEDAFELYSLADKYDIEGLKVKCSRILINGLNINNAFDYLALSINHNDEAFKQRVLDYLTSNMSDEKFKELILSPKWVKLLNEEKQVAREIVDEIFKVSDWH